MIEQTDDIRYSVKTDRILFDKLISWDNLWTAFRNASRGKRRHPAVAEFEYHLEENLFTLQDELKSGKYRPRRYNSFYIHEPKRRLISAASFRDRVVHHALCNIMEQKLEQSFIFDSYANRIGKGTHRALNRCQQYCRKYRYVLQCDIRQFFPSIDHSILKVFIKRHVQDRKVLRLIDRILSSGEGVLSEAYDMVYFPGDNLLTVLRPRGLPIGNLTSQFWANVYLNPFDHFVKRELKCKAYLRYVDDFLLFGDDKVTLWQWREKMIKRLEQFRLTIHPAAHPRLVSEGIPFLGFILFPERRRLKRRKCIHYQRKLKALMLRYHSGEIPFDKMKSSIQGWINHARYGNTVGLRKSMLKSVIL